MRETCGATIRLTGKLPGWHHWRGSVRHKVCGQNREVTVDFVTANQRCGLADSTTVEVAGNLFRKQNTLQTNSRKP